MTIENSAATYLRLFFYNTGRIKREVVQDTLIVDGDDTQVLQIVGFPWDSLEPEFIWVPSHVGPIPQVRRNQYHRGHQIRLIPSDGKYEETFLKRFVETGYSFSGVIYHGGDTDRHPWLLANCICQFEYRNAGGVACTLNFQYSVSDTFAAKP